MECNKDEAVRAREIAEIKMQTSDFVGARKFGLKAQELFPDLDNIIHLLTVCDVHCAAQKRVSGSEMDWYGILQVAQTADDATIKKQYRKLALILHPDKNKFPGSEAAFKLIGEANRLLSDSAKRSLYDMKVKVSVRSFAPRAPPHQVNRNLYPRTQFGAPDVANVQFTGSNVQQQASASANGQETFWTCCPYCNVKYQYYKDILNRSLRCQSCLKPFTAYDLGPQGAPQGPRWSHPAYPSQKELPTEGTFTAGSQSSFFKPSSSEGVQRTFSSETAKPEPAVKTKGPGGSKSKGISYEYVNLEDDGKEDASVCKTNTAKHGLYGRSRNISRKRGRNLVVESSESLDTSSSDGSEDVVMQENGSKQNSGLNGGRNCRTSSRNKRNVSYVENLSDDDVFVSPPKVSKVGESSRVSEEGPKRDGLHNGLSKTNSPAGMYGAKEEVREKGSATIRQSLPNRTSEASESNINANSVSEPELFECLDPEFSDFDKDKAANCFDVGQIWAVYDTLDGMPRFYARVMKVYPDEFKLRITWLESRPDGKDEINWSRKGLPVSCGKFKIGRSQDTVDRPMFSHMTEFIKGYRSYVIYPRKGETWALFKEWDIRWSSDPVDHRCYKYEIVEVLSDFVDEIGVNVVRLEKIKGFVSLFQQKSKEGFVSYNVPPRELFRFSHRIPSFKMTGTERAGVPKGCFELDTAALPSDLCVRLTAEGEQRHEVQTQ